MSLENIHLQYSYNTRVKRKWGCQFKTGDDGLQSTYMYIHVHLQVSHGAIDRGFINNIPQSVMALDKDVDGWSLSSSYGLFRRYSCNLELVN